MNKQISDGKCNHKTIFCLDSVDMALVGCGCRPSALLCSFTCFLNPKKILVEMTHLKVC